VLFYVAVRARSALGGEEIPGAQEQLKARWGPMSISLDGQPHEFQGVSEGSPWGAIRRVAPDHAMVICASYNTPDAVRLVTLSTIDPYLPSDEPSA
jgi:hypothetical protein